LKKYVSLIALISIFVLLQGSIFGQNTSEKSDASIVFEEEKFDFGDVNSDSVLTHVFKFENTGTDTLFIRSVRGS
jgi:hypothetical protein